MKIFLLAAFSALCLLNATAQNKKIVVYRDSTVDDNADSRYILSYGKALVLRVFTGNNMSHFNVDGANKDLHYAANFQPNIGFGVSYSFLTANFSFGVGDPSEKKGKTNSFSFQSSLYYRKWAADVLIKTYKGMYLKNDVPDVDGYYTNPKLRSDIFGVDLWRILNPDRFSYKAMMTQNEWQKRSAGSFLIGGEIYYGHVNAHDSIVPPAIAGTYLQRGVSNLSYVKLGPGIGYAYDFVFQRHWFIAASFVANMDASFNKEIRTSRSRWAFAWQPNYNFRIGAGYNSQNWNINFQYVNNGFPIRGAITEGKYSQYSGNYRLSFNHRFYLSKRKKKLVDE